MSEELLRQQSGLPPARLPFDVNPAQSPSPVVVSANSVSSDNGFVARIESATSSSFLLWCPTRVQKMEYSTVQRVTMPNPKAAVALYFAMFLVLCYGFWSILASRSYCEFRTLTANDQVSFAYWGTGDFGAAIALNNPQELAYCNGSIDTDYYYGASWLYMNNTCQFDYAAGDITRKQDGQAGLRVTSSAGIWRNGIQETVDFSPAIENLRGIFTQNLDFEYENDADTYVVNTKTGDTLMEIFLDGDKIAEGNQGFGWSVKELAEMGGFNIDETNTYITPRDLTDCTEYCDVPQQPIYRVTGFQVVLDYEVSNFKHLGPMHMTQKSMADVRADLSIQIKPDWNCEGFRLMFTDFNARNQMEYKYSCDVSVSTNMYGTFCFFGWGMLISSLVNIMFLFTVAGVIVDTCFSVIDPSFKEMMNNDGVTQLLTHDAMQKQRQAKGLHQNELISVNKLRAVFFQNVNEDPKTKNLTIRQKENLVNSMVQEISHASPNQAGDDGSELIAATPVVTEALREILKENVTKDPKNKDLTEEEQEVLVSAMVRECSVATPAVDEVESTTQIKVVDFEKKQSTIKLLDPSSVEFTDMNPVDTSMTQYEHNSETLM